MRVANGVYVLPIPRSPQEPESFLNLTLIVDEQNGNMLVDAGLPDQAEAIGVALLEGGIGVRDLKRIIFTPGHTPGHLSLYLERSKVLIAGDALRAERGSLTGPNPSMTLEMGTALQSLRRLADLEIDTIVCYHGGVVSEDANGQLRRVIQEVSGERDE